MTTQEAAEGAAWLRENGHLNDFLNVPPDPKIVQARIDRLYPGGFVAWAARSRPLESID